MSISAFKLYKKLISELKFRYSELEYVEQEVTDHMQDFEKHYRKFCDKNNISIGDLEGKNRKKVDDLLGTNPVLTKEQQTEIIETSVSDEVIKKRKVFQRSTPPGLLMNAAREEKRRRARVLSTEKNGKKSRKAPW